MGYVKRLVFFDIPPPLHLSRITLSMVCLEKVAKIETVCFKVMLEALFREVVRQVDKMVGRGEVSRKVGKKVR